MGKFVRVWGEVRKVCWGVGRGVERVLEWGQRLLGFVLGKGRCGEMLGEMCYNLGERRSVGRRVVS